MAKGACFHATKWLTAAITSCFCVGDQPVTLSINQEFTPRIEKWALSFDKKRGKSANVENVLAGQSVAGYAKKSV